MYILSKNARPALLDCVTAIAAASCSLVGSTFVAVYDHGPQACFNILPISFIVWSLFSLASNYATAGAAHCFTNHSLSPIWMFVENFSMPISKLLPFGSGIFTRYQRLGWKFDNRSRTHEELRDAYMAFTPRTGLISVIIRRYLISYIVGTSSKEY